LHDDLQLRLATAFPPSTDANLIRGFAEGILLGDSVLDSEPFLQNAIGRDVRGHLRRAGILYRLQELCRRGDLPFEATISRMPRGYLHWLEMRSDQFVAHVCRTDSAMAFPEDTATRQDERMRNQNDLFEPNIVPLKELAELLPGLAVWLTFGGNVSGQLQHLCWAMPSADGESWLAHINILRRAAATGAATEPDPGATQSLRLKFKDHIQDLLTPRKQTQDDKG
jgi:hypothetical protein